MTPVSGASLRLESIPAIALRIVLAGSLLIACQATTVTSSEPTITPELAPSIIPTDGLPTPTAIVTPAATISPAPTPDPDAPTAIREGPASAGTYTTTRFEPTVRLTLPSDGWTFFFQDDNDEMVVGKGDVELTGGRVAEVVDPTSHLAVPAPDDLVSWFGSHPAFEATAPQPVIVGGIVGESIDVTNVGNTPIDIFAYPLGNLKVATGTTARVWVLPYGGSDLVFVGFAPSATFQEALPTLQALVDSIVIAPD